MRNQQRKYTTKDFKEAVDKKHAGLPQLRENGVHGSFTSADGRVITIVNGQIINIV